MVVCSQKQPFHFGTGYISTILPFLPTTVFQVGISDTVLRLYNTRRAMGGFIRLICMAGAGGSTPSDICFCLCSC
jgi:hypothetical protein